MKAKRAKTAGAVEVYAFADRVEITAHGDLILWRNAKDDRPAEQNLAFASGVWEFVYAASVMDGSAVAVQSWPGQITN